MSKTARLLAFLSLVTGSAALGGCANAIDLTAFYGTFSVSVSAFGKSDDTIVVASEGLDAVLFNFTHGFSTDFDAPNATGLRVQLDDTTLNVEKQPIHVDHSSGELDGTVTGTGTATGSTVDIVLKVVPSNVTIIGTDGNPLPAGTTVDYAVKGSK